MSVPDSILAKAEALLRGGFISDAIALCEKTRKKHPDHPGLLLLHGSAQYMAGKLKPAIVTLSRCVKLAPGDVGGWINLGNALQAAGRIDEAVRAFRTAQAIQPQIAAISYNLGNALSALGDMAAAMEAYGRTIALQPTHRMAMSNLGIALTAAGRAAEAEHLFREALALGPETPEILTNLGNALTALRRLDEAVLLHGRAIAMKPDLVEAHYNLGNAELARGQRAKAMTCFRRAVELRPDFIDAHVGMARLFADSGQADQALAIYRAALRQTPDSAVIYYFLGITLRDQRSYEPAREALIKAIALDPTHRQATVTLAALNQETGRHDQAARSLDAMEQKAPSESFLRNAMALSLYRDDISVEQAAAIHARYGSFVENDIGEVELLPALQSEFPLRIGYLSSDFRHHSIASNMLPVIRAHNRELFAPYLYSCTTKADQVTSQFRAEAREWRDVSLLSDQDIARCIRADGIHILVCLASHFDDNRPAVCARRAAPVQISLHDVATSGLKAMDYLIGDYRLLPRGGKEFFTERLLRLPQFYVADMPRDLPPLPISPRTGPPVYGCFNYPAKITPTILGLWGHILARQPTAHLVLKYHNFYADAGLRDRFTAAIRAAGAKPGQIKFIGEQASDQSMLALYNDVDIALDPFPFSGSTTSFQALSMGIPVITLPGETMVSRWSASMLRRVGLSELVATSPEDYVTLAVEAAGSVDHWRMRRAEIRDSVRASSLCDTGKWTRNLERLYRAVWRRHSHG
ncbi:hypothetical protein CU669_00075 [Paramagnetospirillum kuznetsovii]|uniref:protein O-GlcNAc transferase n=1 Tax=Paramagnetospirillum kuznetsovii TaxID=2053833 RepID=A0A364P2K0_9PROT|nr:tetratricopeptide repeat protein [Paramagnetospirillum kuznetsovii]RAU23541.1 hypothetical protein CU669_00075 [Paramagnetospirillum kuznetsovii]